MALRVLGLRFGGSGWLSGVLRESGLVAMSHLRPAKMDPGKLGFGLCAQGIELLVLRC